MSVNPRTGSFFVILALLFSTVSAQNDDKKTEIVSPKDYRAPAMTASPALKAILTEAVADAINSNPGFKNEEVAVTVIEIGRAHV